jgi:hypothetical protein
LDLSPKTGEAIFEEDTTGLAGKQKMPPLMVFLTKIYADKHCEK